MDTNVDRGLDELAGLEADMEAVAGWLADYWPHDLPAPRLGSGFGIGGAIVSMRVLCMTADDLRRAAEVMGVEVVDSGVDCDGRRHETATLGFVRANVHAFGVGLDATAPVEVPA